MGDNNIMGKEWRIMANDKAGFNVYELMTVGSYDDAQTARDAIRRHWSSRHGTAQFPGFAIDAGDGSPYLIIWSLMNLDDMENDS